MNKKGLEIQTLVITAIAVVLLLLLLGFMFGLFSEGNIFSGPDSICAQTGGFIGGCN